MINSIADIQILDEEKLQRKHQVHSYEVEEALLSESKFFLLRKDLSREEMSITRWDKLRQDAA